MKVASWNVNGFRSVVQKGFWDWHRELDADVVALQETKFTPGGMDLFPEVAWARFFSAVKPGYSGVALLAKRAPDELREGLGIAEFDSEGRVLAGRWGKTWVISAYFPNSQREHTRLGYKLAFCQAIQKWLKDLVRPDQGWVLSGDYNIAHEEIDLRNPKTNTQNAGFLPEERAWMTQFLAEDAVDVFRKLHPSEGGHYTWWSYRPGVRQKNIGWRIDYHCVNPGLFSAVKSCFIQPGVMGSDHCPIVVELIGCEKVIHQR